MVLTLITFLFVLSLLVLVHEFGHFLLAKKTGIKVEEFGFGFPPRLIAKKIGETVYSLNWLPFGGFVKLFGEELEEGERVKDLPAGKAGQESKKTFWAKSKKIRTAVIVAGVLANFFLGVIAFTVIFFVSGIPTKTNQVRIVEIASGSPAEKIGMKKDDIILAVENQTLVGLEQFTKLIQENKGKQVKILLKREGENLPFFTTPRTAPPAGEGPLGVVISDIEIKKYPLWQMFGRGLAEGLKEAFSWAFFIFGALGKMLTDLFQRGIVPRDVAGPIGIFQITGKVAQAGILSVFQFIGILSVNLAVINILPFPALDGGRLIFIIYEAVARRRPKPSLERWTNAAGMAFLLVLIFLITINDIIRLTETTGLISRISELWPF